MNTEYDFKESSVLVAKLVTLTRNSKVEWTLHDSGVLTFGDSLTRYSTPLEGDLEAQVWTSNKSAGFRLFEKAHLVLSPPNFGLPVKGIPPPPRTSDSGSTGQRRTTERDLLAISIDHEEGPAKGEIYVDLIALLELARRSADKIEPKVDRIKQYLDKLAV
jgi:hypothetical protein